MRVKIVPRQGDLLRLRPSDDRPGTRVPVQLEQAREQPPQAIPPQPGRAFSNRPAELDVATREGSVEHHGLAKERQVWPPVTIGQRRTDSCGLHVCQEVRGNNGPGLKVSGGVDLPGVDDADASDGDRVVGSPVPVFPREVEAQAHLILFVSVWRHPARGAGSVTVEFDDHAVGRPGRNRVASSS